MEQEKKETAAIVSAGATGNPTESLKQFQTDPVGFIQAVVEKTGAQHLDLIREQMEMQSAIHFARRYQKDFEKFEPFILQEVAQMIQSDADGILDPWPDLIEQATQRFRTRFVDMLKNNPEEMKQLLKLEGDPTPTVYKEKAGKQRSPEVKPSYTRQQIASMSLSDFMSQEASINQALQEKRIK
jgi:hypothetical protein